jgi:hypothetical protein
MMRNTIETVAAALRDGRPCRPLEESRKKQAD